MLKQTKAITLVSLVVTIIVLMILAGVSISMLINQDGIIDKSKMATEKWKQAIESEANMINELLNGKKLINNRNRRKR